jgi:HAD superfamily hydrolase (TIGR01509 family)
VILKGVLFDWDGTLVDSALACFRCYARAFEPLGIPYTQEDFARTYSPDGHYTYAQMGIPEALWAETDARWRAAYRSENAELLPDTLASLRRLREEGLPLGIVTGGDRGRVTYELDRLRLGRHFQALVCGDDVGRPKPHPAGLEAGLGKMRLAPTEALYIGDSPEDVLMSRAVGVPSIGIPGGFPNRSQLAEARPDRLFPTLAEAVDAILAGDVVPLPSRE